MRAQILMTSVEPTEYLSPSLSDLEPLMTAEEKERAVVKGWLVKGVEPGSDEVFTFRIGAEQAPADIDQRVFQPMEVDCRGVTGRGWVRSGQTKGSVEATITFQAVAITPIEMSVVLQEQQRRAAQAKADNERRSAQRDFATRMRAQIEDRLKGGTAPVEAAANNGRAAK